MNADKDRYGITLIELLVVVTLIGLLAAVAAPSVGSGIETVRLRSTAERVAATLRTGHDRALRTHHYMEVSIDRSVELRDLEAKTVSSWEIPETIRTKKTSCLIYPDGTMQADITLTNAKGRAVEVKMDPFTLFPEVKQ